MTTAFDPPREVAPGVTLVDTGYAGRARLAAAYVIRGGESAAVVETAATPSVPRILAALEVAKVPRDAVSHVVVTHVHLDHAGGAGALLRELPRARLVVHPRGARHLVDPAKLVAGTVAVYGEERFREFYGDIVPVPADRVIEAPDGLTIDLGARSLRILDAPGHAKHHVVVLDSVTRGFFTGDAFGLSYREADGPSGPFVFATTTPVQLDPPAFHATLDRILAERPERVYLTHFGMVEGEIPRHAATLRRCLDEHVRRARATTPGRGRQERIRASLQELLVDEVARQGAPLTAPAAMDLFADDLRLNAQGLEVWLDGQSAA